ncbi:MAG: hypothetical protein Rubg2KO_10290 [Rubricoccaceae bacterium]
MNVRTTHSILLPFEPSRDGFVFRNSFSWTEADLSFLAQRYRTLTSGAVGLVGALGGGLAGGVLGRVAGGVAAGALGRAGVGDGLLRAAVKQWSGFGLCGGMALSAIERWPGTNRVPTSALKPGPMRTLLWRRQQQTLDASLVTFARVWIRVRFVPGNVPHAPFADELNRQLDRIQETLTSGRPALVGLVGDAPDPFALHQVVVFGIERRGDLSATLSVYDPNAPGRTRHIVTRPAPMPGRTCLTTDMPTGPTTTGRCHISTRAGELSHLFEIRL